MEENGSCLEISKTSAVDDENVMQLSLHQYYQDDIENTKLSSIKVERASKFLLLPEISKLVGDNTKAIFLLSKGLTHDEVSEAFKYYSQKQKESFVPDVQTLALHNVNQTESIPLNATQRRYVNHSHNGLSLFFNLCQRVMVLAGISTAFYYLYQKWRSDKIKENKAKKEQKRIEEELNQIKSELQKITAELKLQQMTGKTNANLAAEINSLKAILVSRQHFEELHNKKVSLPSWQLNKTNSSNNEDKNSVNDTAVNGETPECSNASQVIQETSHDSIKIEILEKNTLDNICQNGNQSNVECEEKNVIKSIDNDQVSDSTQKTKKTNSKNRNSKSKVNENGKNISKQNGVLRENLIE